MVCYSTVCPKGTWSRNEKLMRLVNADAPDFGQVSNNYSCWKGKPHCHHSYLCRQRGNHSGIPRECTGCFGVWDPLTKKRIHTMDAKRELTACGRQQCGGKEGCRSPDHEILRQELKSCGGCPAHHVLTCEGIRCQWSLTPSLPHSLTHLLPSPPSPSLPPSIPPSQTTLFYFFFIN